MIKIQKAVEQVLLLALADISLIYFKNEDLIFQIVQLLILFHFLKATKNETAYSKMNLQNLVTLIICTKIIEKPQVTFSHTHNNKRCILYCFKIIVYRVIFKIKTLIRNLQKFKHQTYIFQQAKMIFQTSDKSQTTTFNKAEDYKIQRGNNINYLQRSDYMKQMRLILNLH